MDKSSAASYFKDHPEDFDKMTSESGGNQLHWCKSKRGIIYLINSDVAKDARNKKGETPLHLAAMNQRLDCVIALLSHGAQINVGDNMGNTPLHTAVIYNKSLDIVKALILFGANMCATNNRNNTPLMLAKNMLRSETAKLLDSASQGQILMDHDSTHRPTKKYDDEAASDDPTKTSGTKKPQRILCLDGGGIRGLVLIEMLLAIEKIVGRPLKECFDWIAGTSTGASVALAIATGMPMQKAMALYFRMKDKIFEGNRPYDAGPFERILQETFGVNTKLTDITGVKILIPALRYRTRPPSLHFFRNYDHPIRQPQTISASTVTSPNEPSEQLVWKAARASGAAPAFFPSIEDFMDGGLMANNPTLDCLTEIFDYRSHLKRKGETDDGMEEIQCVLSLGTGRPPVSDIPSMDIFWPGSFPDTRQVGENGFFLLRMFAEQASQSDGRVVDRSQAWCESHRIPFFRYSPQLDTRVPLDCIENEKLINMLWQTRVYFASENAKLQDLAKLLIG